MVRKCVIFHCLMFMLLYPAYSDDMDEATLKAILKESDTTLVVYFMPFTILTRIPVTKERMRESFHYCKLHIVDYSSVRDMSELILAARADILHWRRFVKQKRYEDVRLLIDVISGDAIVYSVGISRGNKSIDQILEAFYDLLGLRPDT